MWGGRKARRTDDERLATRQLDQLSEIIGMLVSLRDNPGSIIAHPTVYAVRTLIADTVAMLPMVSLRGTERIEPQPSILRRPDPAEPRRNTIEKIVNSLTRYGNAFLYVFDYDAAGFPLAVRHLDPSKLVAVLNSDQTAIDSYEYNARPIQLNRVKHIPLTLDPGPLGTSPIIACAESLAMATGLWAFAGSFWQDGGVPPYALKHPRRLTAEQADEFITQWIEARRKRRPALLSDGLALEQYEMPSANDSLLLDGLHYLDAVIARAFLVPPSLVNTLSQSSLTYSTVEQETRRWLQMSTYPQYLARIEAAFTDFTPRGQEVKFDTSNLLRTDYAARVQTGATATGAGLLSIDEWRAQEGLPPLPNPDPVTLSPSIEGI